MEKDERRFALLRIAFGIVFAIDAWFKWQPAFFTGFLGYFGETLQGQSPLVADWINLWILIVGTHPYFFALVVALAETLIAIGLLFGLLTRVAIAGGAFLMLLIWAVPEGFGGPYIAGSTDIGVGVIYALVFAALWIGKCWRHYSIDAVVRKRFSFVVGQW